MSSPAAASVAPSAAPSTIYLGLDVHKESITVAVLPAGAPAPTRVEKLSSDLTKQPNPLMVWVTGFCFDCDAEDDGCWARSVIGSKMIPRLRMQLRFILSPEQSLTPI